MTKLEEEILTAIEKERDYFQNNPDCLANPVECHYGIVAAEVAKKYIIKAFHANPALRVQELCGMTTEKFIEHGWLKENGVIE